MPRVIAPFAQFFDGEGDPLVDGWLYFYYSNTNNTLKDTFADDEQSIPNANPLQLDAEGRCPNVFGTGLYRVALYADNPVTHLPGELLQVFDPVRSEYVPAGSLGNFSEWDSIVTYQVGELVIFNGEYYRSIISDNLNNPPDVSVVEWEKVDLLRYWNTNVTYILDNIVIYDSQLYFSLAGSNSGNQPDISPLWWTPVGGGTILTNWEEFGNVLRPVVTGAGYLGDATHLIQGVYLEDNAPIYLGNSQDATILFDGTDLSLTGSGVLSYNGNLIFDESNLSTDDTLSGDSDTVAVSESAVKGYVDSSYKDTNLLINPLFEINQRVWVSGTNLASIGDYFVDRWCAGTANTAPTLSGVILTIPAGDSVKQIVEDVNIADGTYTISWVGTSSVSIDGGGAQSSPYTFVVSSGTHVEVEFDEGTLSYPMLVSGSNAGNFFKRQYGDELELCYRYYQKSYELPTAPATATLTGAIFLSTNSNSENYSSYAYPIDLRVTPTISYWDDVGNLSKVTVNGVNNTSFSLGGISSTTKHLTFNFNIAASPDTSVHAHFVVNAELT